MDVPVITFSMSRQDYEFRVDPYVAGNFTPISSSNYSILYNTGNVPIEFEVNFGDYENVFSATNTSGVFYPGENTLVYVFLNSVEWSPRTMDIHPDVIGRLKWGVRIQATAVLRKQYNLPLNIHIEVRLPGYSILDMGTAAIQYLSGPFVMEYQEERTVDYYLTGVDEVTLVFSAVNITIVRVEYDGHEIDGPLTLGLSEETPSHINVTVRADYDSTQGLLIASASNTSGVMGEVHTSFQTNPAPPGETEEGAKNPFVWVILGVGMAVFVLLLVMYMKGRKGGGTSKGSAAGGNGRKGRREKRKTEEETIGEEENGKNDAEKEGAEPGGNT